MSQTLSTTIISLFFWVSNVDSHAQSNEVDQLAFYADVMVNASSAEHRIHANEVFKIELESALNKDNSFDNSFEDVPWIFVRYAPSKDFRFISWQVEESKDQFKYYSYFQLESGELVKWADNIEDIETRETYTSTNGYSSIIHQVIPSDDYYLLASYRQRRDGIAQKICEVLTIENGNPSFGKSLFYENDDVPDGRGKKRVIMNYSPVAGASMNININDDEKLIVFDHIISVPGKTAQEGMIQVPDGSYEAYVLKEGNRWLYNPNLYEGLEYNPKSEPRPTANQRANRTKRN
jgi:hypothetical protein